MLFRSIGSGADHTNNVVALAFGVFIIFLVIVGSILIMANLNWNMMDMPVSLPH